MNLDQIKEMFITYTKKFDLQDENILGKFNHSFRVMQYSKEIALSLDLSNDDIELATIIGLLHDIARFKEWTEYHTFNDSMAFDHGDVGANILNDMLSNSQDKYIIIKAVKNHNKLKIEDGLDKRTIIFCKIIRDADKLDIMKEQCKSLKEDITFINKAVLECIHNKIPFKNEYCVEESDGIFRMLSFIYDLHFPYSYNFVLKQEIIEEKINILKEHYNNKEELENIKSELLNYLRSR